MADGGTASTDRSTHIHDLPDAVLSHTFSLVRDVRTRNSISLTCSKWRSLERLTRTSLSLRGNIRDLFLLPNCFPSISHLDLSLLSPWGHHPADFHLLTYRLLQAFPSVVSLTVYARSAAMALNWPNLRHVSLVRWHPRPNQQPGDDLSPLLSSCPNLTSLDLSRFYCWPEDVPAALSSHPLAAESLTHLDLLCSAASEGYRSSELVAIAVLCTNLRRLLVPCVFNPRFFDFVGDEGILAVAAACPKLSLLHLADPFTLSPSRDFSDSTTTPRGESRITRAGLIGLFSALPLLEDLTLDLCHDVVDSGSALEILSHRCPRIRSLKLGRFQGVCIAAGLHLDGVAVCGGLRNLCIKNSDDLSDSSLATIARGCRQLSRFEIHGCAMVSETGIKKLAATLRSTLKDVMISNCKNLDSASSLRALGPIRDRIERLHIDCVWEKPGTLQPEVATDDPDCDDDEFQLDGEGLSSKKCRYSDQNDNCSNGDGEFWCKTFNRLRSLSLWLPAGEVLSPLPESGLENCPELEEISIKVEGDCRTCTRPTQPVFGLSSLTLYPQLSKMKLDCGEAIGYVLTAPTGHMDLSLWERFYLHGIGDLNLCELDYWPPQDKEVNRRSLSLPATGLIRGCLSLRKLFIHGTANEHFMSFFLEMPNLRDVQLREDYYPAPDNDMSTEMRVDSCSRFEDALNRRIIPD
ncbi:F-box/LRR-repeat MAX2 homolog A [Phalaenopsis equestris]|uniref:F-box/LRR-repeat MAX2 homolog A n=1 Tax=Phalaenopsis equestris TaxID=78828 RepID=UPI0009E1C06E|nr:F-box/LRR-repeat MAX2 homolog A [Phalaenopsis equestris]